MKHLNITVTSAELCEPVSGVRVKRQNPDGQTAFSMTDKQGIVGLEDLAADEILQFEKEGFVTRTINGGEISSLVRMLENRITGYHDRLWACPGEHVNVHAHSVSRFSAKLYRHGLEKQLILDCGEHEAVVQQVPDALFVEKGLKWKEAFTCQIPDEAKPGLYSFYLEPDSGEPFAVPLVVSTPPKEYGRKNKLLVLASTNTWQSYNLWGGRSRYRNFEESASSQFLKGPRFLPRYWIRRTGQMLPTGIRNALLRILKQSQPAWKFKRLSIKRPMTNCRLEDDTPLKPFTNHLAGGEWRLLAWLERENIGFDIVSGFELHQDPDLLKNYDAIVLSTHCEYWSERMYRGLKKYHQQNGLWILNLSGNSIYREVDFDTDGSMHCTSLFFEKSCEDETQLIGVRFTETDYGTAAPYKAVQPDHWVFENTGLDRKTPVFGKGCLNQNTEKNYERYDPGRPGFKNGLKGIGASGWECDKLSRSARQNFTLIAKGCNPRGGAHMVVREPENPRGGVFSASSITFTGSLLVDDICSGIVKNVIRRVLEGVEV